MVTMPTIFQHGQQRDNYIADGAMSKAGCQPPQMLGTGRKEKGTT